MKMNRLLSALLKGIVAIIFLQLASCSVRYSSIKYAKPDNYLVRKVTADSKRKKFKENAIFVHTDEEIYQLFNVQLGDEPGYTKIIGEVIELDTNYISAYDQMKGSQSGVFHRPNHDPRNDKYIQQTHLLVDSVSFPDGKVLIQEEHLSEAQLYHTRMKMYYYLLIPLWIAAFGFIVAVIFGALAKGCILCW